MKVDEEQYPWVALQILMNIWTLNHLNASKRSVPIFKKVKCSPRRKIKKGTYRVYGDDIKEHFFCLIYEKGLTAGKAGKTAKYVLLFISFDAFRICFVLY